MMKLLKIKKKKMKKSFGLKETGAGYCLTEEDYNEREKEVKQHEKKKLENKKADI